MQRARARVHEKILKKIQGSIACEKRNVAQGCGVGGGESTAIRHKRDTHPHFPSARSSRAARGTALSPIRQTSRHCSSRTSGGGGTAEGKAKTPREGGGQRRRESAGDGHRAPKITGPRARVNNPAGERSAIPGVRALRRKHRDSHEERARDGGRRRVPKVRARRRRRGDLTSKAATDESRWPYVGASRCANARPGHSPVP